jgi:phospholipid transport system transporter-binding protein
MNPEVTVREGGELCVAGPVTIDNVVATVARGAALFNQENQMVDLGGITEVDSSAVSMLLEWQRETGRRKFKIQFANIPPKLHNLVRLYGVAELVPLAEARQKGPNDVPVTGARE